MSMAELFPQTMAQAGQRRKPSLVSRITRAMFPYFVTDHLMPGSTETSRNTQESYFAALSTESSRKVKLREYDVMDDESVVISSALDLYADNATSGSAEGVIGKTFQIISKHKEVTKLLDEVTHRLKLKQHIWAIARSLAKYGDDMHELIAATEMTVDRLKPLQVSTMERVVDRRGTVGRDMNGDPVDKNASWVQRTAANQVIATFDEWQIVHWKLPVRPTDIYGSSILRTARRLHKQIQMSEDAMVIQRLLRAHMRYAFMIDTGKLPPEQAFDFVEDVKRRMSKKPVFDRKTGKMRIDNNPLTAEDDFWLPSGEKSQSDVKVLQGSAALTNISDIKHLVDLMFAALKVPKAYLGFESGTAGRHVINTLDIQFARVVRRIQYQLAVGLYQIFDTALTLAGLDPREYTYEIQFPIIGTEDELRRWQINQIRYGLASMIKGSIPIEGITDAWILRNIMGVSDVDIAELGIPDDQITPGLALSMGGGGVTGPEGGPTPESMAYPGFSRDVNALRWLIDYRLASRGHRDVFGPGTTAQMASGLSGDIEVVEQEARERLKEAISK